jgi:hypothetical protein
MITITYIAIDGYRKRSKFKTLKAAAKCAQDRMGRDAEIGSGYAVTSDGIGTMYVQGATLEAVLGRAPEGVPRVKAHCSAGVEQCLRCDGHGYQGFEEDSGKPFTCFACCETGYVPAGSQEELIQAQVPVITRVNVILDDIAKRGPVNYEDDIPF